MLATERNCVVLLPLLRVQLHMGIGKTFADIKQEDSVHSHRICVRLFACVGGMRQDASLLPDTLLGQPMELTSQVRFLFAR